MNNQAPKSPSKEEALALVTERMSTIAVGSRSAGGMNFDDLGKAVTFGDTMSKSGAMIPEFLRGNTPMCAAIAVDAIQWGFSPFHLARQAYQAKQDSVVGYQAQVFVAALRQLTGITLKYRFTGTLEPTGAPVKSHKGNEIAKHGWRGDLTCTAYAEVDGEMLEWESPPYDMIGIKNSPLWHNDPRQQFRYYAGRGWTRAYRPDVMMGAYSNDEVEAMSMRDVTPERSKFKELTESARAARETPSEDEATSTPEEDDSATTGAESAASDESGDDPSVEDAQEVSDEPTPEDLVAITQMGQDAAIEGFPAREDCPFPKDSKERDAWLGGFDAVAGA